MTRHIFIPIFAAFLCIATACSDSPQTSAPDDCIDGGPLGVGEFSVAISGGSVDVEFCKGFAESGENTDGWELALQAGPNKATNGMSFVTIVLITEEGGRPIPDTYNITNSFEQLTAPPGEYGSLIIFDYDINDQNDAGGLLSVGGTLIITESSPNQVSGQFDFEARGNVLDGDVLVPDGPTIRFAGSFTSMNQDLP